MSDPAMTQAKRVLVVEDNPAMANVIRFNLELAGIETEIAYNGSDAWQRLQEVEFDLVVTDFQMPEMDGRALSKMIRASERYSSMPIILLTAKELEIGTSMRNGELEVNQICQKPFSPSELTERILEELAASVH